MGNKRKKKINKKHDEFIMLQKVDFVFKLIPTPTSAAS